MLAFGPETGWEGPVLAARKTTMMHRTVCPVALALASGLLSSPTRAADDTPATSAAAPNPVPHVVITGTRENEDNYRIPAVDSIGPLGTTPILDTPYSDRHPARRPDRELAGDQLQGRLEVPAAGGLPGTAGSGHPAAADPRHAGRQLPEHQDGRDDHVHHRRHGDGAVPADRSGQRPVRLPVRPGQSVRHVQLRVETPDGLRPCTRSTPRTTATASAPPRRISAAASTPTASSATASTPCTAAVTPTSITVTSAARSVISASTCTPGSTGCWS